MEDILQFINSLLVERDSKKVRASIPHSLIKLTYVLLTACLS